MAKIESSVSFIPSAYSVTPLSTPISATANLGSSSVTPPLENGSGANIDDGGAGSGGVGRIAKETMAGEKEEATLKRKAMRDIEIISERVKKRNLQKRRTLDDEIAMRETATSMMTSLAADHVSALYPDTETPFTDATDVVRRLLPYHVFQYPREDTQSSNCSGVNASGRTAKGKGKATEADFLREEIAETKFALECWGRRRALQDRFRRIRIRSGERMSPDDQSYALAHSVLESERTDTAALNSELRNARAEVERLEREKRASQPPPKYTSYNLQPSASNSAQGYSPQYRPYSYPYAHPPYGPTQYTYTPQYTPGYTTGAYSATPSYTPASFVAPTFPPSGSSTAATTTPSQNPQPLPVTPQAPIPVQLPSGSLAALAALGLRPQPVASLVQGAQLPPIVLKATLPNGMLSLDINVGSLQASQTSGLALILSTLSSKGIDVDGVTAASTSASVGDGSAGQTESAIASGSSLNTG